MSQESTFERSQRAPVALQFERSTWVFQVGMGSYAERITLALPSAFYDEW